MKKFCSVISTIILFSLNTFAQPNFAWAKPLGGTGSIVQPYGIATDNAGNVYTSGAFQGTIDFDPGAGTFTMASNGFNLDAYISKLDANGNFVWAKQIGGSNTDDGYGIAVEPASGNVYITGDFIGNVDFDPNAGTFTMAAVASDAFVLKLDVSGNFVWAKQITGPATETGWGIALDLNFNVYTTGQYMGTVDFDPSAATYTLTSAGSNDIYVSKLSSAGNFVWASSLGGTSNDIGFGIVVDPITGVYTTGSFQGTADFDPGASTANLISGGNNDIFVSKLDLAAGAYIWGKSMGGNGNDVGVSVQTDAVANVYTTGTFNNTADFDPSASASTITSFGGSTDAFVSKLNSNGVYVWARQLGGTGVDGGNSIKVDASSNVYTTGYFSNTADFDPGAGTYNFNSAGFFDIFISKLDNSGSFVWAVKMGSTNTDMGEAITVDNSSAILTTGYFANTVDFDPTAGTFNLSALAPNDIYVQKLSSCTTTPTQPGAISGATSVCSGTAYNYSIALVGGATGYSWMLPGGWSGSSSTNTLGATPGTSGVFSVVATNSCGASAAQTLSVTVNTTPTLITTSSNYTICSGQSTSIFAAGANSFTWNPGGVVGPSVSVSPTITTQYTVVGTSTASCNGTGFINITVNTCANITSGSVEALEFEVYPNPTANLFFVEFFTAEGIVEVYNTLGAKIASVKTQSYKTEIDLSKQPNGIYFVRVSAKKNSLVKKIIKE